MLTLAGLRFSLGSESLAQIPINHYLCRRHKYKYQSQNTSPLSKNVRRRGSTSPKIHGFKWSSNKCYKNSTSLGIFTILLLGEMRNPAKGEMNVWLSSIKKFRSFQQCNILTRFSLIQENINTRNCNRKAENSVSTSKKVAICSYKKTKISEKNIIN